MVDFRDIDPTALVLKARGTEEKEAGEAIYQTDHLRVIVGARVSVGNAASLFIELSIYPRHDQQGIDVGFLKKQYLIVKELHALGYASFQDGMVIIAEAATSLDRIAADLGRVRKIVLSVFGLDVPDPLEQ